MPSIGEFVYLRRDVSESEAKHLRVEVNLRLQGRLLVVRIHKTVVFPWAEKGKLSIIMHIYGLMPRRRPKSCYIIILFWESECYERKFTSHKEHFKVSSTETMTHYH